MAGGLDFPSRFLPPAPFCLPPSHPLRGPPRIFPGTHPSLILQGGCPVVPNKGHSWGWGLRSTNRSGRMVSSRPLIHFRFEWCVWSCPETTPVFHQLPTSTFTPGGMCVTVFIPLPLIILKGSISPSLSFGECWWEWPHLAGLDHQPGEPTLPPRWTWARGQSWLSRSVPASGMSSHPLMAGEVRGWGEGLGGFLLRNFQRLAALCLEPERANAVRNC